MRAPQKPRAWEAWEQVCFHEAGHAIVADFVGVEVQSFRLEVRREGEEYYFTGGVKTPDEYPDANGEWDHNVCFAHLMVSLAGQVVEREMRVPAAQTKASCIYDQAAVDLWLDRLRDVEDRDDAVACLTTATTNIVRAEMPRITALTRAALRQVGEAMKRGIADGATETIVTIEGEELRALLGESPIAAEAVS